MPTMTIPRLPLIRRERAEVAAPTEGAVKDSETLEGVAPAASHAPERRARLQAQRLRRAGAIAAASLVVSVAAIVTARALAKRYVRKNGLDM